MSWRMKGKHTGQFFLGPPPLLRSSASLPLSSLSLAAKAASLLATAASRAAKLVPPVPWLRSCVQEEAFMRNQDGVPVMRTRYQITSHGTQMGELVVITAPWLCLGLWCLGRCCANRKWVRSCTQVVAATPDCHITNLPAGASVIPSSHERSKLTANRDNNQSLKT